MLSRVSYRRADWRPVNHLSQWTVCLDALCQGGRVLTQGLKFMMNARPAPLQGMTAVMFGIFLGRVGLVYYYLELQYIVVFWRKEGWVCKQKVARSNLCMG